jgi:hypothetical protein
MITAQLRLETPSLQKLRNETLENGKRTRKATQTQKTTKERTNERTHTHSLNHSLLVCSLARVTLIPLLRFSH